MLKQIAPEVRKAILLFNPETAPYYPVFLREFGEAPSRLGAELVAAPVRKEGDIETVVAKLASERSGALTAAAEPFITAHHCRSSGAAAD